MPDAALDMSMDDVKIDDSDSEGPETPPAGGTLPQRGSRRSGASRKWRLHAGVQYSPTSPPIDPPPTPSFPPPAHLPSSFYPPEHNPRGEVGSPAVRRWVAGGHVGPDGRSSGEEQYGDGKYARRDGAPPVHVYGRNGSRRSPSIISVLR